MNIQRAALLVQIIIAVAAGFFIRPFITDDFENGLDAGHAAGYSDGVGDIMDSLAAEALRNKK